MRKLLAIALAFTLLGSTVGVTVQRHYCMSIHVATNLIPSVKDACGMEMPPGHDNCKDDHQQYRVYSPILLSWFNYDSSPSVDLLDVHVLQLAQLVVADLDIEIEVNYLADSDPPLPEPDIFTRDQAFLL